jgi:hypothetical protein
VLDLEQWILEQHFRAMDVYLTKHPRVADRLRRKWDICDPLGTHAHPYVIVNLRGCGRDALA